MKLSKTILCAGVCAGLLAGYTPAQAVDFKITGLWQFGFGLTQNDLVQKVNGRKRDRGVSNDDFRARQRIRLWLTAVASENLSGTLNLQIGNGHQRWGQKASGAEIGTSEDVVQVRQAYLDWMVPDADVKVRMGLQEISLPWAAVGGAVLQSTQLAAVTANAQLTENVGLTAMWARPLNDNFPGYRSKSGWTVDKNYLDNMDLFMLSVPLKFEELEVTPWAMYGFQGKNTFRTSAGEQILAGGNNNEPYYLQTVYKDGYTDYGNAGLNLIGGLFAAPFGNPANQLGGTNKQWGSMFWAGLPIKWHMDPINVEFEVDYGWVEAMGRYSYYKSHYGDKYSPGRASTERQGWLIKALAEYKMDWGVPGIYGWYGSGDDGNLKNGSERMPYIYAETYHSAMLGDSVNLYGGMGANDLSMPLGGSWGVGVQVKDMSFMPKLKHLVRAVWIGGTNSPGMVKYAQSLSGSPTNAGLGWEGATNGTKDYYLTTKDNLLEFDLQNTYQMYDNLRVGLNGSYVVNMIDKDLWKRAANTTFAKQDMWNVDLVFRYQF